ncbi:MAG: UbiA family prenyltransferase [Polyangiales bacterium]
MPPAQALLGTTLAEAGAHSLNCYIERDIDRRHGLHPRCPSRGASTGSRWCSGWCSRRCRSRCCGSREPAHGPLRRPGPGSYVLVYTPMKTRTPAALYVGAVPGALPPLMGWTAATGRVESAGLVLFAILSLQLPHFFSPLSRSTARTTTPPRG